MARWNEAEFVQRAGRIAHDFAVTKTSLNDLTEKVARDENLQPDEIRTLVRLANVATFQELFKNKDTSNGGDKMIEFESGDPEAVINRIVSSAGSEPQSANIQNDKLASAWDVPDQMRETRLGRKFDEPVQEKIAADDGPKPMRFDLAVLVMRKLSEDFGIERLRAGQAWEEKLNKLAAEFRKAPGYGPTFDSFEKDAFSDHGMDAWPELKTVRESLKMAQSPPAMAKVAELQARHVTETTVVGTMLKEAMDLRAEYERFTAGLAWIQKNMPVVNG